MKEIVKKLKKEKNELAQRIMALNNAIYFNDEIPSKDLMREQLEAMDDYHQALEARILDLQQDIDEEEEEDNEPNSKNFIDQMCDELNERIDELIDLVHTKADNDNKDGYKDLEGKRIISTDPCRCDECCNDGSGCIKLALAGNKHICVK